MTLLLFHENRFVSTYLFKITELENGTAEMDAQTDAQKAQDISVLILCCRLHFVLFLAFLNLYLTDSKKTI
jgi:hypothetical protein